MNPATLVKICGVTRLDQAKEIAALGADFIGINLWPKSKRHIALHVIESWRNALPSSVKLVAVMVNPSKDDIEATARSGLFAMLQLHGEESPSLCSALEALGLKIIKAFQVRDEASLEPIRDYTVNDILLDSYSVGIRGGSGTQFPWELSLAFKRKFASRRFWLAGGLTPENVSEAVRSVQPYAVDVASGVESGAPGVKDMSKVAAFIRNAKNA